MQALLWIALAVLALYAVAFLGLWLGTYLVGIAIGLLWLVLLGIVCAIGAETKKLLVIVIATVIAVGVGQYGTKHARNLTDAQQWCGEELAKISWLDAPPADSTRQHAPASPPPIVQSRRVRLPEAKKPTSFEGQPVETVAGVNQWIDWVEVTLCGLLGDPFAKAEDTKKGGHPEYSTEWRAASNALDIASAAVSRNEASLAAQITNSALGAEEKHSIEQTLAAAALLERQIQQTRGRLNTLGLRRSDLSRKTKQWANLWRDAAPIAGKEWAMERIRKLAQVEQENWVMQCMKGRPGNGPAR